MLSSHREEVEVYLYPNSMGFTLRPLCCQGRDPVLFVQGAEWALGLVWMGQENLTPNVQA
jgi:hypothetical protein